MKVLVGKTKKRSFSYIVFQTFEMSMPSKIQLLMTLNVAGGGNTAAPPFDVDGGGSVSES